MARNLTIFGPNWSRRRELKSEKFSNERVSERTKQTKQTKQNWFVFIFFRKIFVLLVYHQQQTVLIGSVSSDGCLRQTAAMVARSQEEKPQNWVVIGRPLNFDCAMLSAFWRPRCNEQRSDKCSCARVSYQWPIDFAMLSLSDTAFELKQLRNAVQRFLSAILRLGGANRSCN